MQVQFQPVVTPYLCQRLFQNESLEETMELKLSPEDPDMSSILSCWGQSILRSKQWQADTLTVTGGVMVWVLYRSAEDDSLRTLETWVPFQGHWTVPDASREGVMRVCCHTQDCEARMISARRMIVRTGIGVHLEAYQNDELVSFVPGKLEDDIQLLQQNKVLSLPILAGEKTFTCEETVLTPSADQNAIPVYANAIAVTQEQRISGEHILFKGTVLGHILYRDNNGLETVDFQMPFSQLAELDREVGDCSVQVMCGMTGLEMECGEQQWVVKCSVTGQYLVEKNMLVPVVEDAYSPLRSVEVEYAPFSPVFCLDRLTTPMTLEASLEENFTPVDAAFYMQKPETDWKEDMAELCVSGKYGVLRQNDEGKLTAAASAAQDRRQMGAKGTHTANIWVEQTGIPVLMRSGNGATVKCGCTAHTQMLAADAPKMICALTVADKISVDSNGPSVILCRAKESDTVWSLAKAYGSTVKAIEDVNKLTDDPEEGKMLLIPCYR